MQRKCTVHPLQLAPGAGGAQVIRASWLLLARIGRGMRGSPKSRPAVFLEGNMLKEKRGRLTPDGGCCCYYDPLSFDHTVRCCCVQLGPETLLGSVGIIWAVLENGLLTMDAVLESIEASKASARVMPVSQ